MNSSGKTVGTISQIQNKGENLDESPQGSEISVSMTEPIVDRHIHEGETLFTVPKSIEAKTLQTKFISRLTVDEVKILEKIIEIRRQTNPLYAF